MKWLVLRADSRDRSPRIYEGDGPGLMNFLREEHSRAENASRFEVFALEKPRVFEYRTTLKVEEIT